MSTLKVNELQHNNGTSAVVINNSGQMTLPAIPFLRMQVSSTTSITLNSGKGTVPFNNVIDSRGITHNTSTYKFQVPVAGLYHFSGSVRFDNASSYLWWKIEDGTGGSPQASALVLQNGNSGSFITSSGSLVMPLSASTDYLIVMGDGGNTTANVQAAQTFMTVYLVG